MMSLVVEFSVLKAMLHFLHLFVKQRQKALKFHLNISKIHFDVLSNMETLYYELIELLETSNFSPFPF